MPEDVKALEERIIEKVRQSGRQFCAAEKEKRYGKHEQTDRTDDQSQQLGEK